MIDYDRKRFATEEFVEVQLPLFRSLKIQRALHGFTCPPGAALLDLGCGEGAFTRTLKKIYPQARVDGCDVSEAQVACARNHNGAVEYKISTDVLPYEDESFHAVFVLDVLEHVAHPAQMLAEIARVLRKGGLLLLHCPCEGQPLTLHWLCWKLKMGANLKRDLVGHIQRFTHRRVIRLAADQGLVCRRLCYEYHFLGQLSDLLTFWRHWCIDRVEANQATVLQRLLARIPTYRFFWILRRIAYWESRLLGSLPWAMGLDARFEKI